MRARWLALLAFLVLASCATVPPRRGLYPDPLEPPVPGPALSKPQAKAVEEAVALAEAGRVAQGRQRLASLAPEHPVRQLAELVLAAAAGEAGLWPKVAAFAERFPNYVAAWRLAFFVGQREGKLLEAAAAAEKLASLAPGEGWAGKARELEERFASEEEKAAAALFARGEAAEAFSRAKSLLARVPERRSLRELAVRAALAAGQVDEAKLLVLPLPEDGPGLELKAQVAAAEGKWEVAVALLRKLPATHPGRCQALRRAEEKARWQSAPEAARKALASARVSRAQLASLLVFYFPQVAQKAGGPVPLFEDVVGIPEQAEVITVVRAGLLPGDPLTRRFAPTRPVTARELSAVAAQLLALLGVPGLELCQAGATANGCLALPPAEKGVSGQELAAFFAALWERVPC